MADTKISALTAASAAAGSNEFPINEAGTTKKVTLTQIGAALGIGQNLLKNGNFINNSTNGYGSTPDDWTSSNANPVQGGIPALTKQNLIDGLGIADGDIEGLWNLNGNFTDLSANGYNLTAGAGGAAPTDTSDGLMAQAKVFAGASSQYAVSSSATNLRITGSKTLIGFVKPTNVSDVNKVHFGLADATDTYYFRVRCSTTKLYADCSGLTGQGYSTDVDLQAGKWYMVVLRYNATANTLDIIINGIKKSVSVTGTPTVTNQEFAVGRNGNAAGAYASSTLQNCGVISVALTDNQVKKLFAMTMYKGQKIRRATTNAYAYQQLPQDLVERLRGKTVALRADLYQEVASTAQISIHQTMADGTTDETIISATDATTGSWLSKVATGTLEADVVTVEIRIKHSTSDGNSWFRNVSLYEGSTLLPYDHSKDDWSRFPRLLKMDIPPILDGYSFEENKWYQLTLTTSNVIGISAIIGQCFRWFFNGKTAKAIFDLTATSNAAGMDLILPFLAKGNGLLSQNHVINVIDNNVAQDTGIVGVAIGGTSSATIKFGKTNSTRAANAFGGFTTSSTKGAEGSITCEID